MHLCRVLYIFSLIQRERESTKRHTHDMNSQHFFPQIHFLHCNFFYTLLATPVSQLQLRSLRKNFHTGELKSSHISFSIHFLCNEIITLSYTYPTGACARVSPCGENACEVLMTVRQQQFQTEQARAKYLNTCVLPLLSTCYRFHQSYKVCVCVCLCNL